MLSGVRFNVRSLIQRFAGLFAQQEMTRRAEECLGEMIRFASVGIQQIKIIRHDDDRIETIGVPIETKSKKKNPAMTSIKFRAMDFRDYEILRTYFGFALDERHGEPKSFSINLDDPEIVVTPQLLKGTSDETLVLHLTFPST